MDKVLPFIWTLVIAFILLVVTYGLGILAVKYINIPRPKNIHKKLFALMIGSVFTALLVLIIDYFRTQ